MKNLLNKLDCFATIKYLAYKPAKWSAILIIGMQVHNEETQFRFSVVQRLSVRSLVEYWVAMAEAFLKFVYEIEDIADGIRYFGWNRKISHIIPR